MLNDQLPAWLRYILFETLPYMRSILSPNPWNAASAAMEISEATSAYSIAVAPFRQTVIRVNRIIARSWLTRTRPESPDRSDSPLRKLPNACGTGLMRKAVDGLRQRGITVGHAA